MISKACDAVLTRGGAALVAAIPTTRSVKTSRSTLPRSMPNRMGGDKSVSKINAPDTGDPDERIAVAAANVDAAITTPIIFVVAGPTESLDSSSQTGGVVIGASPRIACLVHIWIMPALQALDGVREKTGFSKARGHTGHAH